MAVVFALEHIFDAVSARFVALGDTTPHYFGRRPIAENVALDTRIVWTPGDPNGALGEMTALTSRAVVRNPRPLATLLELATITISANDPAEPESERAQYHAARALYDLWYACMHEVAHGTFTIEDDRWLNEKIVRSHGAAIQIVIAVQASIHDTTTHAVAPASARAVIAVTELDHTQSFETEPAPTPVRAAATAPITLSTEQTIDGVLLVDEDLVLVAAQADAADNGLYVVSSGAWARADITLVPNLFVPVTDGTVHSGRAFVLETPAPIVVGTTPLTFTRTTPE